MQADAESHSFSGIHWLVTMKTSRAATSPTMVMTPACLPLQMSRAYRRRCPVCDAYVMSNLHLTLLVQDSTRTGVCSPRTGACLRVITLVLRLQLRYVPSLCLPPSCGLFSKNVVPEQHSSGSGCSPSIRRCASPWSILSSDVGGIQRFGRYYRHSRSVKRSR
jgi:hypothetical protein